MSAGAGVAIGPPGLVIENKEVCGTLYTKHGGVQSGTLFNSCSYFGTNKPVMYLRALCGSLC